MKLPRLTVWTVRLSLLYLALGFSLGALLLFHKGIPFAPILWAFLPLHIESLMAGWTLQLVIGVAFWILPRFASPPKRGNEKLAWLSVIFLNGGIWLVGVGPWFHGADWPVLVGRILELFAAVTFALHAWVRIKPPGA